LKRWKRRGRELYAKKTWRRHGKEGMPKITVGANIHVHVPPEPMGENI
jgi:hypothetical protein